MAVLSKVGIEALKMHMSKGEFAVLSREDQLNCLDTIEVLQQKNAIYKKHFLDLVDKMLAEFDKDGWCRLVATKE